MLYVLLTLILRFYPTENYRLWNFSQNFSSVIDTSTEVLFVVLMLNVILDTYYCTKCMNITSYMHLHVQVYNYCNDKGAAELCMSEYKTIQNLPHLYWKLWTQICNISQLRWWSNFPNNWTFIIQLPSISTNRESSKPGIFVKDQEKMEKYQVSIPKIKVIFRNVFLLPLGPWDDT
jgi:hypothetical protein